MPFCIGQHGVWFGRGPSTPALVDMEVGSFILFITRSKSFDRLYCPILGALNRFLSWKWFDPLGRLTFCVYLLHVALIGVFFKYMNDWGKPIDRNSSAHLWIVSLAVIVLSFVLALVFCLMVEFPFQSLDKIILPSKKPSKQEALSELSATKI